MLVIPFALAFADANQLKPSTSPPPARAVFFINDLLPNLLVAVVMFFRIDGKNGH
jgi:hypothetical protein